MARTATGYFARHERHIHRWCLLFTLPALTLYLMFQGWPIIASAYYSLHDWSGLATFSRYIGLENFSELVQDPYFWNAYFNGFKFMIMVVPALVILGLFVATILNNKTLGGRDIYRTLFFLPVVSNAAIMGIVMVFIWGADGPVNQLLSYLGLVQGSVKFLSSAVLALPTAAVIYFWKNLGINIVYWLAGLQSVPDELYEAAYIDGSSRSRAFFSITLPLVAPIGAVIALLNVIGSLKVFDLIMTMTGGGPFFASDVVSTYIYRYAFSSELGLPRIGYAAAAGMLFGLTIVVIGAVQAIVGSVIRAKTAPVS